jgi:hypothetical protein
MRINFAVGIPYVGEFSNRKLILQRKVNLIEGNVENPCFRKNCLNVSTKVFTSVDMNGKIFQQKRKTGK